MTHVLATNLLDTYPANAGHIAVVGEPGHSGPIEITEECYCLEICHYYDIESSYDGGNVKVSTDGGATWAIVFPTNGYPGATNSWPACIPNEPAFTGWSGEFVRDCFDLTAYMGQTIQIGFFFGSDGSVQYPGWYIKWIIVGGVEITPVEDSSWGGIKAMYR